MLLLGKMLFKTNLECYFIQNLMRYDNLNILDIHIKEYQYINQKIELKNFKVRIT